MFRTSRFLVCGMLASVLVIAILSVSLYRMRYALQRLEGETRSLRAESSQAASMGMGQFAQQRPEDARSQSSLGPEDSERAASVTASPANDLGWIHRRRNGAASAPFFLLEGDGRLNMQLAIALRLSESEYDRLNVAIQETRRLLDVLSIASATQHVSTDGRFLELNVPSMAADGSSLHSKLLNSFAQVLGAERYRLFNSIAGDSFDNNFDDFGLKPVNYVVKLVPENRDGALVHAVTRSYADPHGSSGGSSGGVYSTTSLQETHPVLAHFLLPKIEGNSPPAPGP